VGGGTPGGACPAPEAVQAEKHAGILESPGGRLARNACHGRSSSRSTSDFFATRSFLWGGDDPRESQPDGLGGYRRDLWGQEIRAARENLGAIGASDRVRYWDARRLSLGDGSANRVVTNMPWGRQVAVDSGLEHLYRASFSEMLRVLAPGGRIVVLTGSPEVLAPFRSRLVGLRQISLSGQRPHILVFGP
jgi:Putative RNA methylase family UPF0020